MKIEKHTPSMREEAMECKSTHETIPFPFYEELIEDSEAIKAMWCESFPEEPFIKDEILQASWNAALLPWLETAAADADFFAFLEKFLGDFESPEWKVMQCTFTFMACSGPVNETMYIVVKSDAEIVKAEPHKTNSNTIGTVN